MAVHHIGNYEFLDLVFKTYEALEKNAHFQGL